VASIALYPDPLPARVLTASTFSNEIPGADGGARAHSCLTGDPLARAINEDNLPRGAGVIALLPFPSVLDRMAGEMGWTEEPGNAVLADRASVMDAVQDQRERACSYGYLRSNQQYRVVTAGPGDIEILPVNPTGTCVPYYDPVHCVPYYDPVHCVLPGAARIFHRRRDRFRSGDFRQGIRALGLGRHRLRVREYRPAPRVEDRDRERR
jgi:hypothetical protein